MVSFSIGGVLQAEYIYNHCGQQAVRKLYGTAPVTIHSVFGPDGNRIAEYDEATGALLREYVWLDGVSIAVREGGMNYLVRVDHIGRPVFATNAAGVKVWSLAYLPFGGVRTSTGVPMTLRFPGQWFQSENGLHQNWMRDYDPTLGRYLQADPLGLVDGASVYGYARQNPGRWTDPSGEQGIPLGADPNPKVPGGPWTWSPDPGNRRGGTWTNDRGGSTSLDIPGSHWDTHDSSGAPRERYDRWGNKLDPNDPHKYERDGKPRLPPTLRFPKGFLPLPHFLPPCLFQNCDKIACSGPDDEFVMLSSLSW